MKKRKGRHTPKHIHYIDSIAGAGKTEEAVRYAIRRANRGNRIFIMQPTKELISATKERIEAAGYEGVLREFTSDSHNGVVIRSIAEFLKGTEHRDGCILLTTWKAWITAEGFSLAPEWDVIIDEIPNVFETTPISSPATFDQIRELIDFDPPGEDGYSEVCILDKEGLKEFRKQHMDDDALKIYRGLISNLLSCYKTFVSEDQYNRILDGDHRKITFYHVLESGPLVNVGATILGANFKESELYHVWKHNGVQFREHGGFGRGRTLPDKHDRATGERLDIYWLEEKWTKHKKYGKNKDIYLSEFKRAVREIFGDEQFIYSLNNDDDPLIFLNYPGARKINPVSHGSNEYRDIHNIAVYSIYNLSSDRAAFLKAKFGIDYGKAMGLKNREFYYQGIMRSSLRQMNSDPNIKNKIVVIDKGLAEYIHSKFPGSRIHKFESKPIANIEEPKKGRARKHESGASRTKAFRDKKKAENLEFKFSLLKCNSKRKLSEFSNEKPLYNNVTLQNLNNTKEVVFSGLASPKSKEVRSFTSESIAHFVADLQGRIQKKVFDKKDNVLINTTQFNQNTDGQITGRKRDDVVQAFSIWMDMDEGNVDSRDFAKCFSGVQIAVYSSFSSTASNRRWSAIIPLSRPVNAREYNRIAKDLLLISSMNGFKFDQSKKQANDFFYAPCQGLDPESSFFMIFDDSSRKALDVDAWFKK